MTQYLINPKILFEQNNEIEKPSGKINSKKQLFDYAMKLAKGAFGNKTDTTKIMSMVNNAIEKSSNNNIIDWKKASGIITGSFNK